MKLNFWICVIMYAFLKNVYAFIPKFKLKNIIANRALVSSVFEKFSFDFVDETVLTQFTHDLETPELNPIYIASAFYLANVMKPDNSKIENMEIYRKSKQIVRQSTFIFFMIFMKNVEAAT